MKPIALTIILLFSTSALADWPYRIMKIKCTKSMIEIIDYSAYDEDGEARLKEKGVIDVDQLSTWRHTQNDLNVPDKPLPLETVCSIPSGKYKIILNNRAIGSSAGWWPPVPVVDISEISNPRNPVVLFKDIELSEFPQKHVKIIISKKYPHGIQIDN
jgi:hypothetical protein